MASKLTSENKIVLLNRLREIAEINGGKLLDTVWINDNTKYKFQYQNGQLFEAFAYVIKKNGWPKSLVFYKNHEDYMREMKEIAINNNGKLISAIWKGAKSKYLFKFKNNQEFLKSYSHLKANGWPKEEKSNLLSPEELLKNLSVLAESNDLILISTEWKGVESKYKFKNKDGVECEILGSYINEKGMPKNPRAIKNHDLLNELKKIAIKNEAILISEKWIGDNAKYLFEIFNGDQIELVGKNVRLYSWPKKFRSDYVIPCDKSIVSNNKTKQDYINNMIKIATENSGKLLSAEWKGSRNKYLFENKQGVKFEKSYKTLMSYGWPKERLGKFKNDHFNALKEIAEKNGGRLLSLNWQGSKSKYQFENKDGFQFLAYSYKIMANGWPMSFDRYKTKEYQFDEMSKIAIKRGGKLLSKTYINNTTKYEFIDAYGEYFELSYGALLAGQWNGNNGYISEPICRQAINHLFCNFFVKTKKVLIPKFTGRKFPLELDGFCEKLKIAFEYQGHPAHWDKCNKKYIDVNTRDQIKEKTCKNLDIVLIIIPPFENKKDIWEPEKIINHIKNAIYTSYENNNKICPFLNISNFKIDFFKIKSAREYMYKLQNIATINKGKLITKEWYGSNFKYEFKFRSGNIFFRRGSKMMESGWPLNEDRYLKRWGKNI